MGPIQVKQLDYDLTPTSRLALVGHHLKTLAPLLAAVDAALPVRSGVASSDICRAYLGLLVQGRSDFDAIENLRGDTFFRQALGIGLLPSSPTLRQRIDAGSVELGSHVPSMIERLLARSAPDYGALACGSLPLDIDTFAMDNSGTTKEGVGRTYAGVDSYCPLADQGNLDSLTGMHASWPRAAGPARFTRATTQPCTKASHRRAPTSRCASRHRHRPVHRGWRG